MIFVDTNIIIDLLGTHDTPSASWSRKRYASVFGVETLVCNQLVLAEAAAGAERPAELLGDLEQLQIDILVLTDQVALAAGKAHGEYRRRGGTRQRVLPDFLIAGHAATLGATLMTRDRRLASYFPDLTLITPETHP
ncbi:type II toxin-antitoxin system VapC family toxin [Sphingomonas sp. CLY1604]|uniref:type II toxin-antitoxin system VapC family toxin n=1 Tax=Sphingomonas sp. CLY1604 TaxID=3457786 RepID=UPI003FD8A5B1